MENKKITNATIKEHRDLCLDRLNELKVLETIDDLSFYLDRVGSIFARVLDDMEEQKFKCSSGIHEGLYKLEEKLGYIVSHAETLVDTAKSAKNTVTAVADEYEKDPDYEYSGAGERFDWTGERLSNEMHKVNQINK